MKVFIKTLGCRVNQVESQAVLERFSAQGHAITQDLREADLCLLNTCSVTHNADRDAEREIRKISRENPQAHLIITGCYAMAKKNEILAAHPTAQVVLKTDLGPALFGGHMDWTVKSHAGRTRAFVKIQDGCDCFCSYCIVPYARPQKTSKPKEILLAEIKDLIARGYREIVLTGINIGNYQCPQTGQDLAAVMPDIFALGGGFRLRFSSIEINTITDGLLAACRAGGQKFCNYFHIPLQNGSDAVLQNMRRRYTAGRYLARLADIRAQIPRAAIFCDIIAGYPSETKENFEESLRFLDAAGFAGMHVFSYSRRAGTPAAAMEQVPDKEIRRRADILHAKDKALRAAFAQSLVGTEQQFLAEEATASAVSGVLSNFQRAVVKGAHPTGNFMRVKITSAQSGVCHGVLF
ncbi:MAG: MiaB/RimO family radical SAM methylthiotransferase [Elusimicrobiota bacterium]|jgi:threonylcarbamoyladenosine tRNA methylthiotransferase MtaB|nr:MiaB/RimO family radical SAM methylthiotransferase [Elusimicrobiota bacterium]